MDKKNKLLQCADAKREIEDIKRRIAKIEKSIKELDRVADTVKGSRPDGTIGPIKVEGYPVKDYDKKKTQLYAKKLDLRIKEDAYEELIEQCSKYVDTVRDTDTRIMLRLYYIEGNTWEQTATIMNKMYPKRKKMYTDENLRKRNQRFFEKLE